MIDYDFSSNFHHHTTISLPHASDSFCRILIWLLWGCEHGRKRGNRVFNAKFMLQQHFMCEHYHNHIFNFPNWSSSLKYYFAIFSHHLRSTWPDQSSHFLLVGRKETFYCWLDQQIDIIDINWTKIQHQEMFLFTLEQARNGTFSNFVRNWKCHCFIN